MLHNFLRFTFLRFKVDLTCAHTGFAAPSAKTVKNSPPGHSRLSQKGEGVAIRHRYGSLLWYEGKGLQISNVIVSQSWQPALLQDHTNVLTIPLSNGLVLTAVA